MNRRMLYATFAVLSLGWLSTGTVHAYQDEKPTVVAQQLPLKHSRATETAKLLKAFFGEKLRIVADERSNFLTVSGDEATMVTMRKLVDVLDAEAPAKDREDMQVNVIHLKHIAADVKLDPVLKTVTSTGVGKFAFDPSTNSVIVSGNAKYRVLVEELLKTLDQPKPAAKKLTIPEKRVRVVWLASAGAGAKVDKDVPQPPDDLKEVVAELAAIGLRAPFLVSQVVIKASATGTFEVQGSAPLGSTPCLISVSGSIGESSGTHQTLQISIDATSSAPRMEPRGFAGGNMRTPVCRIRTQISAPLSHPVVLGVTPTDHLTSIFVVQLLP